MLKTSPILRAQWSSTLRLPKSTFPARPDLAAQHTYLKKCTDDLYSWQAAHRPAGQRFVLHDGPPYANGSLHVGHAVNKILKDITCRIQLSRGKRVEYIPGWDCHGLPIEVKALQALGKQGMGDSDMKHLQMKSTEIREAARKLAATTIEEQKEGFRAWAVMGDWGNAYRSMEKAFELRQLRVFKTMVENGLIYRQYKPVYWSPSSGTALAEAELEYDDEHVSLAAFIKLKIVKLSPALQGHNHNGVLDDLTALVWTTTPWTLPANKAIAVNNDLEYSIVKFSNERNPFLIATSRIAAVLKLSTPERLPMDTLAEGLLGSDLVGIEYLNPFQTEKIPSQPIIHANFVSSASGSGLVHVAPGHGFEDYDLCNKIGIIVAAPVDDGGRFTDTALPDGATGLVGKAVLTEGSEAVLQHLDLHRAENMDSPVWATHKYVHKYPIDWRTRKPVIIRATAQWFADVDSIKAAALRALDDVEFIPEAGKIRLQSFVNGRSQWCISRQRAWGVPIPALYRTDNKSMDAYMTVESVQHIIQTIEKRGIDAWWTDPEDDIAWILPGLEGTYVRGKDTMDVWFDSGTSWTLLGSYSNRSPADVYIEGTDQHRGWFQSSLLTFIAHQMSMVDTSTKLYAPFKKLITHGFALDQDGRKMSKSLGNVISPTEIIKGSLLPPLKRHTKQKTTSENLVFDALGPDALRLWVASSDYKRDIVIGQSALRAVNGSLHKYRVTLKWLLGVLSDYSHQEQPRFNDSFASSKDQLRLVDRIALHQLARASQEIHTAYGDFEAFKAINRMNRYINLDLSSFYFETAKDTMYAGVTTHHHSAQKTCFQILNELFMMMGPVVPLLVEEAMDHTSMKLRESVAKYLGVEDPLQCIWEPCTQHLDPVLDGQIEWLAEVHAGIKVAQEQARAAKRMGSSLECDVLLYMSESVDPSILDFFVTAAREHDLANMLVVSQVFIKQNENPGIVFDGENKETAWHHDVEVTLGGAKITARVLPASMGKCPRCWRFAVSLQDQEFQEGDVAAKIRQAGTARDVCPRCNDALKEQASEHRRPIS